VGRNTSLMVSQARLCLSAACSRALGHSTLALRLLEPTARSSVCSRCAVPAALPLSACPSEGFCSPKWVTRKAEACSHLLSCLGWRCLSFCGCVHTSDSANVTPPSPVARQPCPARPGPAAAGYLLVNRATLLPSMNLQVCTQSLWFAFFCRAGEPFAH